MDEGSPASGSIPPVVTFSTEGVAPVEYRAEARAYPGRRSQADRLGVARERRTNGFSSGIWQCEPGAWRVVFTETEFAHLLEGEIHIEGDDGSRRTVAAGDAFVSPVRLHRHLAGHQAVPQILRDLRVSRVSHGAAAADRGADPHLDPEPKKTARGGSIHI